MRLLYIIRDNNDNYDYLLNMENEQYEVMACFRN